MGPTLGASVASVLAAGCATVGAANPTATGANRDALDAVVTALKDDVYNLALRMLGERSAADDATQEILIQVLTHLGQWRGEAALRGWVWRIAVRHVARAKKTRMEELCSFDTLEQLCEAGAANPPLPDVGEAELVLLEKELRLVCTEGMLLSLDRDHRVAWILDAVFDLESSLASQVLEIDAAAYRKRVQRARERLGDWMFRNCGLVDAPNGCNCRRQIPVGIGAGVVRPDGLQLATHPLRSVSRRRKLEVLGDANALQRAAHALCGHPDYEAPASAVEKLRELIKSEHLRMFDA